MQSHRITRRNLLKTTSATVAGLILAPAVFGETASAQETPVRIGCIGVGGRGTGLLKILLTLKGVEVPAMCDINSASAARAQKVVAQAGRKEPEAYTKNETDYKRLLERTDLDAVVIATPWEWHTPMSVDAMRTGKYVGVEVPCACTVEQCWELVKTSESTGIPCMMLENWSYRRDNLAVLNMIRQGLFGEIVHCHCAHSHNCVYWYFDKQGNPRWSGDHLLRRNADQYPTHSLGPVLSWMDINCGDRFDYAVSMASRSLGIKDQLERKYGKDHAAAKLPYKQGDIVTTMVKTVKGNTIVHRHGYAASPPLRQSLANPRTQGLYNEQRDAGVHRKSLPPARAVGAFPAVSGEVRAFPLEKRALERGRARRNRPRHIGRVRSRRARQNANAHRRLRFRDHERDLPALGEIDCRGLRAREMPRFYGGKMGTTKPNSPSIVESQLVGTGRGNLGMVQT